ncbi:nucleoside diphosphate kinase homolog 5-like [Mucor ambiguus]|uniref:Nucleoside diphosphate kinase n=1 Tax=Mucor ambiguus TaxID=91626 RepID=A0A0C9MI80_9FUNG|nr:nucleoside diphosphate kinase homolog 5-like [Mucor ambiguus]
MITATKSPTHENVNNEFLQARNKLKKVSSTGITEDITVEEEKEAPSVQEASENISQSNLQERTLAILTDTSDLDDIIQHITSNGFTIVATKKLELTSEEAEELYQDHVKQNYYEKGVRWLSSSKLCALVLEKENAIRDWRQLMGPTTYKKARKTSPNSIRALFGKDASQNATHGSDSEVSASKEIEYLFGADLATTTTTAMNTAATAAVEELQEVKHEEPTKAVSEMKQGLEGNNDVIASDTTPVSEKKEADNNNIEDTTTPVKDLSAPEVDIEGNRKPVKLNSKENIGNVKEEPQKSNVSEIEAKNVASDENQAQVQSDCGISNTPSKDEEKPQATKSNVEKAAEMNDCKEEKEQEGNTIAAAANTVTSTAVSVATTVVTGVTEVASAAVSAVSAAVANSGTEQKTNTSDTITNNHHDKTVTIEETPVIHDIIIAEPKSEVSPEISRQIKENTSTETNHVVPGIKPADTHQDKSSPISNLKASTLSNKSTDDSNTYKKSVAETNTDQGNISSGTNTSDDTDAKERGISGNAQQSATTRVIRKSAVHPSNSRIRPPSINKGHFNATKTSLPDTVKKPAEGSDHKARPQSRTTRASNSGGSNGNNGATRIARLSAPIKKAASATPAPADTVITEQQPVKKAVTKVSRNLPRVATLGKPPVPSSKAAEQDVNTTEKPKKRSLSTKSFISRLTAPTVASANKKAAATGTTATETEAPTRRTSTLKKRQSLTVKPPASSEAQVPNKANNTQQQQQPLQHPNSEMTSISTNESFSRPTTPPSATHEKENDDKKYAFIDTSVETTV